MPMAASFSTYAPCREELLVRKIYSSPSRASREIKSLAPGSRVLPRYIVPSMSSKNNESFSMYASFLSLHYSILSLFGKSRRYPSPPFPPEAIFARIEERERLWTRIGKALSDEIFTCSRCKQRLMNPYLHRNPKHDPPNQSLAANRRRFQLDYIASKAQYR